MDHALLSASGADRWMVCTPAPRLEEIVAQVTSKYAEQGSFIHHLAELRLLYITKQIQRKEMQDKYEEAKQEKYFDAVTLAAANDYVAVVKSKMDEVRDENPLFLTERRFDFTKYIPESFGTSDFTIITDSRLIICDLKGGKGVKVSAENNSQLKLYALGAYLEFKDTHQIKDIEMNIIQPRIDNYSTYTMTTEELITWVESEVVPKAKLAWEGKGERVASDKGCRFCKVKSTCEVYKDFKNPEVINDFDIILKKEKKNENKTR